MQALPIFLDKLLSPLLSVVLSVTAVLLVGEPKTGCCLHDMLFAMAFCLRLRHTVLADHADPVVPKPFTSGMHHVNKRACLA